MSFVFGLGVFALWWSMTADYNKMHGKGDNGRPVLSAFFGVLAWIAMSLGPWGATVAIGGFAYSMWMYHEVLQARKQMPAIQNIPVPAVEVDQTFSTDSLGLISFDYMAANGKRSNRTVDVTAVDDEYFEGFCQTALATRTFAIGRVRGNVTDLSTGELLPAKQWAAQAMRDPRNGEVTMGD